MNEGLDPREATEEAARSGRFPDEGGVLRDDSSPAEPVVPANEVDDDTFRPNEAMPFEADLPGVVVTPRAEQRVDPGAHQGTEGLDESVDAEHLGHASQGARPNRR